MSELRAEWRAERGEFSLDVTLRLPLRGVTALFGPSGSGKTTLLRALAGLERLAGECWLGELCWQSAKVWHPAHRRALGYVPQAPSLFSHLSVRGNIEFGLTRAGGQWREVAPLVALLGLEHLLARRPCELSGGEQQRVALARALAVKPDLLLLDEPLSALDGPRKAEILPYLERLKREAACPIVYVSHSLEEVLRLADHLVLLAAGRVVASGELHHTLSQLPLPLADEHGAAALLEGTIVERDSQWQLARVAVEGGDVWVKEAGLALGSRVRLHILARDVSVARQPTQSSIQNLLAGQLLALVADAHPAFTLAKIAVGRRHLWARITRRAAHSLQLAPGQALWLQIKAVALFD
ncbi:MAG: molybdenum ABC transporter ATP-binding protein [Aeromonas sp.]